MEKQEFSSIRHHLGKTQRQISALLGISLKAVQSFEQGWRKIPGHVERQILFISAMRRPLRKRQSYCWVIEDCPIDTRKKCPAWEFQCGDMCWYINGTICRGEMLESWNKKMKICRKCKVFQLTFPYYGDLLEVIK